MPSLRLAGGRQLALTDVPSLIVRRRLVFCLQGGVGDVVRTRPEGERGPYDSHQRERNSEIHHRDGHFLFQGTEPPRRYGLPLGEEVAPSRLWVGQPQKGSYPRHANVVPQPWQGVSARGDPAEPLLRRTGDDPNLDGIRLSPCRAGSSGSDRVSGS
jgi:hypothetical protein